MGDAVGDAVEDAGRLGELVTSVGERCGREPGLDDFLLWRTGTLAHWLRVVVSGAGNAVGWAARTEVPVAASPVARADTAVVWVDGLAALVAVRTAPVGAALGRAMEQVPGDLARLLATDWAATASGPRDLSTDPGWWRERERVERPWVLHLALVHGDIAAMRDCSAAVRSGITRGLASLEDRAAPERSVRTRRAAACFERPLASVPIEGVSAAAVLLAWAAPIAVTGRAGRGTR